MKKLKITSGFTHVLFNGERRIKNVSVTAGLLLMSYGLMAQNTSYRQNTVPITGTTSAAFGAGVLISNTGSNNSGAGFRALHFNTSGNNNSAFGAQALFKNVNGEHNTASGYQALYSNIDGNQNTATGVQSLYLNSSGTLNTANGVYALIFNTVGSNNTATGSNAMHFNDSGNDNTADGVMALFSNSTGGSNTATGNAALFSNTEGSNNTAHGYYALVSNNTGSNNTAIGYAAGPNAGNYSNSTAVGNGAVTTAGDQVRIGNSSVASIGGFQAWSNISDQRVKRDIQEKVPGLEFINKLRPVIYHLDVNAIDGFLKVPENRRTTNAANAQAAVLHTGLIAQEVEKAATDLGYDFSGVDKPKNKEDLYGLRYAEFTVPLIKAVQELSKQNEAMKKELTELKALVKKSQASSVINPSESGQSQLFQNAPNPFNQSTTIKYSIEPTAKNATLTILSITGEKIREYNLTGKTQDEVLINAGELAAGTYIYSLIVDGSVIDTKKITLTQ
jgi:hypothetical protein